MMKRLMFIASLVLLAFCFLSCGKKTNETEEVESFEKKLIAVTNTPTPLVMQKPIVSEVSAEAVSVVPRLALSEENIWNLSPLLSLNKTIQGSGNTNASFRYMWSEEYFYLRIMVEDDSLSFSDSPESMDHVTVFVNEDGLKPKKYGNGDCYITVSRNGAVSYGVGCKTSEITVKAYDLGDNYIVAIKMPYLTIRGKEDLVTGLDVCVEDYSGQKLVKKLQWSDVSEKTDSTLSGIGLLELTKENAILSFDSSVKERVLWSLAKESTLENSAFGNPGAKSSFKMLYDDEKLYLLIHVDDSTVDTESPVLTRKDSVEVFLCWDNSKPDMYRTGVDMHFRIGRDGVIGYENGADSLAGTFSVVSNDLTYDVLCIFQIPNEIFIGEEIGLDIHVNDSFGRQSRDYILTWSDTSLMTYSDLSKIGTVYLK